MNKETLSQVEYSNEMAKSAEENKEDWYPGWNGRRCESKAEKKAKNYYEKLISKTREEVNQMGANIRKGNHVEVSPF